jgi:dihydroorotate dehydrogenase (fumarate)
MMDLTTRYLGLTLPHPFMPGASPMVDDMDLVRRLEDAGAAAIVMHSLFEEQITREEVGTIRQMEVVAGSYPEALTYFPDPEAFRLGPDLYLDHVRRLKEAVDIPVIASLNGATPGGWVAFAKRIADAGADALELNLYDVGAHEGEPGFALERRLLAIVRAVKAAVKIPLAVKLSPFFSSLSSFASELDEVPVDGIVLFNRFYQPDIDPDALEVTPALRLSTRDELLLRLRWLAMLSGRLRASLAVTGGVHDARDAIKAIMAGADAVQMVSAILLRGPKALADVRTGVTQWLEEHEYESLAQMRGSMSLSSCPDPAAYERANYARVLQSYKLSEPAAI